MASVVPNLDALVAHLGPVKAVVHDEGKQLENRAKGRLAVHRHAGDARIIGHKEDTDYVVELVDIAAASIEFGRSDFVNTRGRHIGAMDGLEILGGAI